MSHLLDSTGVLKGNPDSVRRQAKELRTVTANIDTVVRLLRAVSTTGRWESEAGDTFAARVGETPDGLVAIANRLRAAERVIAPYADLLEASQRRLRGHDADIERNTRIVSDRDARLETTSAEDPEWARLTRERGDAADRLNRAEAALQREAAEAKADEQRMAATLHAVEQEELSDPRGYDVWQGLQDGGTRAGDLGVVAKPLAVAGVARPVGMAGRRAFYDEGSYTAVAKASGSYALDIGTFGTNRVIKWASNKIGDAPPAPTGRVASLASTPKSVMANPIAHRRLSDIDSATTRRGRWAQQGKHAAADRVARTIQTRSGAADLDKFAQDWTAVGASRVGRSAAVADQAGRQGKRVLTTREKLAEREATTQERVTLHKHGMRVPG